MTIYNKSYIHYCISEAVMYRFYRIYAFLAMRDVSDEVQLRLG